MTLDRLLKHFKTVLDLRFHLIPTFLVEFVVTITFRNWSPRKRIVEKALNKLMGFSTSLAKRCWTSTHDLENELLMVNNHDMCRPAEYSRGASPDM